MWTNEQPLKPVFYGRLFAHLQLEWHVWSETDWLDVEKRHCVTHGIIH